MKKLFSFIVLLCCLGAVAQKNKAQLRTAVQGGLLEGEMGSAFQLKSVTGLQFKTWAAGIGAGLDYYHTRSIPVFLDLRKTFGKSDKVPFVYANGGVNFPWIKNAPAEWVEMDVNTRAGLYLDAGLGYQIPVFKKSQLFFSVGYSQKEYTKTTAYYPIYITIYPAPPPQTTVFDYKLRRLSLQTGIRF
jgi:hypothetical protein